MLLSPRAINSLNCVEKINSRTIVASFNGNPSTTIVSCYSPTNIADEDTVIQFYDELSSLVRNIPKHNLLLLCGDFNAQLDSNDGTRFSFHQTTNRNGKHLSEFATENELLILNTRFEKKPGKLWTFQYPNNTKAQLDYILINRKWKNSCTNCEAYSSFSSVSSDHRILSCKIRLSLRANKKKSNPSPPYQWKAISTSSDVRNQYILELKNRFEALKLENETNIQIKAIII